jgi:signal transduction histidine kinase
VRTKVAALLVSLIALWAFAAFVTLREGVNLLFVSTLDEGVAQPLETLVPAMQNERRLTLIYLGGHSPEERQRMIDQRARTDAAAQTFREVSNSDSIHLAASSALIRDLNAAYGQLDSLTAVRADIDAGRVTDRSTGAAKFTGIVDTIFDIYDSMAELDDKDIASNVRTLVDMVRAREVLSQEDGLVAGMLTAGAITDAERDALPQLVGTQKFLRADAASRLPDADRQTYDAFLRSATFSRFELLETRVLQSVREGDKLSLTEGEWTGATQPVFGALEKVILAAGDSVIARSTPMAIWVMVRLALAGGLGLLAVIASIVISVTTARALVRQLEKLRNAASELASFRLPRVVERLQHGEKVDVETEAPPLEFGRDEIGQVGEAFNAVQETAVRVAVEQAELRRSVRDVFLSLARRSQALLHRQLGLLDAMERRSTDAEELAELFRIDHLATRMRRNAENLIVLSGATAGRAWRKPVPMVDVLRGALAEVEDYTRVTVLPVGPASLVGRAVGDVIHLLAELIENAVSFSPPQTVVRVGGSVVGNGFAIEIEDRGLGMAEAEREAANEQLNDPPEFKLSSTARLGLYVVGKLAERHGIRVRLTESPYGGTTAIVLLPATIMAEVTTDEIRRLDASELDTGTPSPWAAAAAITPGRHRNEADMLPPAPAGSPIQAALPMATATPPAVDADNADDPVRNGTYTPPAFILPVQAAPLDDPAPSGTEQPPANGTLAGSGANPANAAAEAAQARRAEPPILTPSGLPFRQRDTVPSAPAVAEAAGPTGQTGPGGPTGSAPARPATGSGVPTNSPIGGRTGRGPDEVRTLMSSYRSGTLRGRIDSARLAENNHHAPEWTPSTQESHRTEEEG